MTGRAIEESPPQTMITQSHLSSWSLKGQEDWHSLHVPKCNLSDERHSLGIQQAGLLLPATWSPRNMCSADGGMCEFKGNNSRGRRPVNPLTPLFTSNICYINVICLFLCFITKSFF